MSQPLYATVPALPAPRLPELHRPDLASEDWTDWIRTGLASAFDAGLVRGMAWVIDAVLLPNADELPAMRAAAQDIIAAGLWREPSRYFSFIEDDIRPVQVDSQRRRRLAGGAVMARQFTTEYVPYSGCTTPTQDDTVRVEHWVHDDGPALGTAIALHGFTMGYPRVDGFALFAAELFRAGLDVALVTLPAHGARTPGDARFSGEKFAMPRVDQLNEVMRQAVFEVTAVANWLREQSGAPVGLIGLSLGGYLSALLAGLRRDWSFVVPMVPPVCVGDLAWRFHGRSQRMRRAADLAYTKDELRAAYRVHSPLAHALRVPKERVLIVAGKGDRIVPPEHPHALWQHWGEPEILWYGGSHILPLPRKPIAERIVTHVVAQAGRA